jgi:hypothetical protein
MLQIVDVNTSSGTFPDVEFLKSDFRRFLEPPVRNGTVIFLSNLPAVDNITGTADLMIFLSINNTSYGNYLKVNFNDKNSYISNFIFVVKQISEPEIEKIDGDSYYLGDSSFEYSEAIGFYNLHFEEYFQKFDKIKCFSIYHVKSNNQISFYSKNIIVNIKLTAEFIFRSVVEQYQDRFGDHKISSFQYSKIKSLNSDFLNTFVRKVIEDCNDKSEIGILTKKKIDLITTSTKKIDEIYDNVGSSLSIVTGKPGTGKTISLIRIIHKQASNNRNLRFLTYNNLLVFDIKQNLRQFGFCADNRIAVSTIHSFYFKLAKKLGIQVLFSQSRIKELLETCNKKIEKTRETFNRIKVFPDKIVNQTYLFNEIIKANNNRLDFDEFQEFSKFISNYKNLTSFDEIKGAYLKEKKDLIEPNVGRQIFIEDYYKILELIYLAITDSRKFYEDLNIKDRYDLLSALYKTDKFSSENIIPYENLINQIKTLKQTSNWSKLLIVDECQDFHVLEKEILFKLRGPENIIVATGGKDQLIRHSRELNWSVSLNQRLPVKTFPLYNGSFRQKQNIIAFVNKFSDEYGFRFDLKSIAESKGLGSIIVDLRPKQSIINIDILREFEATGKISGCSLYESIMILIPPKYTSKVITDGFVVNEKDFVYKTNLSIDRHTNDLKFFQELNLAYWDGVNEDKGRMRVPNQNEIRIIHYESCRGLESWSCALISLDQYFLSKRSSREAGFHLADDLFLSEEERRDKYAALWCLMAFTRPIDTLYIHLESQVNSFSNKILQIASTCQGMTILK